jgi:Fic/DOC family protein
LRGLAHNHPFVDGNKRTAVLATYVFYGFNGYLFTADKSELIHLVVDVATGDIESSRASPRSRRCGRSPSMTCSASPMSPKSGRMAWGRACSPMPPRRWRKCGGWSLR